MENNQTLAQLVLDLFSILEITEESDSGREFHPTTIQSCRIQHQLKLEKLLPEIKRIALEIKRK